MGIRLRSVNGVRVALCAVETDPQPGDVYLDDFDHHALSAKFARDLETGAEYPLEWLIMDSQKVRDAAEEHTRWEAEGRPEGGQVVAVSPPGSQVLT